MTKVLLALDCQYEMPREITKEYFRATKSDMAGNDVWLEWYWCNFYTSVDDYYEINTPKSEEEKSAKLVQDWMLETGLLTLDKVLDSDGIILIKHWW